MKNKLMYKAYYVADHIDIKGYREEFKKDLISVSTSEVYYQLSANRFFFILQYGVVVFCNIPDKEIMSCLEDLKSFGLRWKQIPARDDFEVELKNNDVVPDAGFDVLTIGRFNHEVNKMIMMHLAQSVALDHFNEISQGILKEVKEYTDLMEVQGKIKLSHRKALKFIGKTLTTKNKIAENLYILDSPETAWEDEYLSQLHTKLGRHFELTSRHQSITNTLKIIEDNLSVFLSYNHHRESSRLEWIIIILIVIEVLDTLLSKVL